MEVNTKKIGPVIKTIRCDLKIQQKELAKRAGFSVNYLSLVENSKRGIGMKRLNKLANILGIPPLLFFILAVDPPNKKDSDGTRILHQIQDMAEKAVDIYVSCHRQRIPK